jgi:hypothetical protein
MNGFSHVLYCIFGVEVLLLLILSTIVKQC